MHRQPFVVVVIIVRITPDTKLERSQNEPQQKEQEQKEEADEAQSPLLAAGVLVMRAVGLQSFTVNQNRGRRSNVVSG